MWKRCRAANGKENTRCLIDVCREPKHLHPKNLGDPADETVSLLEDILLIHQVKGSAVWFENRDYST